jgi:lipoprotein-anchoring transpeptidase ErfK/SrfK
LGRFRLQNPPTKRLGGYLSKAGTVDQTFHNNAPMPYAIFYSGNFAIHGTNQTSRLGRPASAGCIRLHTSNARTLFAMTKQVGLRNMRVVVEN